MYNSQPCENSWYLREYEFQQEQQHNQWLDTLPEKRDDIINYSVLILEGRISAEEHDWVFHSLLNSDESYERLAAVLDDWNEGNVSPEDELFLHDVAVLALEGASDILFNTPLYEICQEGNFSINRMAVEVLE